MRCRDTELESSIYKKRLEDSNPKSERNCNALEAALYIQRSFLMFLHKRHMEYNIF
uniref:Uncharacterized protein n=1 Tax=Arion vulgaris TaxID=1028688 RepID=A0A0B7AEH2_9EUPU